MARHEDRTFGKVTLSEGSGGTGSVSLAADDIASGSASLSITTAHAVEVVGTFTASHKLKIKINGTEYWIQLDAV